MTDKNQVKNPKIIEDTSNLFQKGCYLQVNVGYYRGRKKLTKKQREKIASKHPDWVSGMKNMIDPVEIKKLTSIYSDVTAIKKRYALKTGLDNLPFISKDLIAEADAELTRTQETFWKVSNEFIDKFPEYKNLAQDILTEDGLYDESDYPDMDKLKSMFKFSWKFLVLDVPNGKSRVLSPEIYQREKQKLEADMQEVRKTMIEALRVEFQQMVEHVVERFSGNGDKPKVFRNTTIDNFYEFFETFKAKNIFQDADLTALVEKAQGLLKGESPDVIRESEVLKDNIKSGMDKIGKEFSEVFKMPRRKIDLD